MPEKQMIVNEEELTDEQRDELEKSLERIQNRELDSEVDGKRRARRRVFWILVFYTLAMVTLLTYHFGVLP